MAVVATSLQPVTIPAQGTVFVTSLNVVVSSLNSADPLSDAISLHQEGRNVTVWYICTFYVFAITSCFASVTSCPSGISDAESLFSEHTAAWAARWNNGHIEVDGDLGLAQAINSSLYYIRSSTRDDWPYGLSPGAHNTVYT